MAYALPSGSFAQAVAGLPGTLAALATAIGGAVAAYQGYTGNIATQRAAYAALKQASEEQASELASVRSEELALRSWVTELAKGRPVVSRPRQAATTATIEPVLPPVPTPAVPATGQALPAFEQLK